MAASMVQFGQRRGPIKIEKDQAVDLRQVTVLPRSEYLRIKETSDRHDKCKEAIEEAARQREAMHLRSKEMVKLWSNTIAEQMRKDAIERAKTQQYYQTQRVKGFHSALLLSEVLKETDAQIELKHRIQSTSKDLDWEFLNQTRSREDEALKREQQKAAQNKLDALAFAEDLRTQMREVEVARAREKLKNVKEGEEIQRLRALHLWEQSVEQQRQAEQRRNTMQAHLEHISNKDVVRGINEQKQALEEEQRKLFLSAKEKMVGLRKEKEAALFSEAQILRDRVVHKLTTTQQQKTASEEAALAKAVYQQEARQMQRHRAEDEKKAERLKAISEHRETMLLEQEQKEATARQRALEELQAKQEAATIFLEKQQQKAQQAREAGRALQDHHVQQIVGKRVRLQQLKTEQREAEVKNAHLVASEEEQFERYTSQVIRAADEAQRNVIPLRRAAKEGLGGGGGQPSYLVQDASGVEMPRYAGETTRNVKELNETTDIQEAKKRLGFTC
ncbi:hypothetical protein NHX12_007693 [Muraenolepis orangiensis]|uniref:Trichohyalin-plectin-homology domain-containing protein n=1 Tax=Muraenolepis orangiensis TaxID=630683 RepID=A0A9Q0DQE1_9TELE|nr:hypothetical protein NHX12_007693 [Muraenolepis orangiensis]